MQKMLFKMVHENMRKIHLHIHQNTWSWLPYYNNDRPINLKQDKTHSANTGRILAWITTMYKTLKCYESTWMCVCVFFSTKDTGEKITATTITSTTKDNEWSNRPRWKCNKKNWKHCFRAGEEKKHSQQMQEKGKRKRRGSMKRTKILYSECDRCTTDL